MTKQQSYDNLARLVEKFATNYFMNHLILFTNYKESFKPCQYNQLINTIKKSRL